MATEVFRKMSPFDIQVAWNAEFPMCHKLLLIAKDQDLRFILFKYSNISFIIR